MKLIKLAVLSAVVLFGLITLIASFIPSNVRISRAIDIHAAKKEALPHLQNLQQWNDWNAYVQSFSNRKIQGDSLSADKVSIRITEKSDSLVAATWYQPGGNNFSSGYRVIQHDAALITIQWYFDFHVKWYPWEKFQSIVYDEQLGPSMEKSLATLKQQIEN